MSWLKSSFAQIAQDALTQAQASIDAALEIEPQHDPFSSDSPRTKSRKPRTPPSRKKEKVEAGVDNWSAWGTSVNSLWENSTAGKEVVEQTPSRKPSKALKLGQGSKRSSARGNEANQSSPRTTTTSRSGIKSGSELKPVSTTSLDSKLLPSQTLLPSQKTRYNANKSVGQKTAPEQTLVEVLLDGDNESAKFLLEEDKDVLKIAGSDGSLAGKQETVEVATSLYGHHVDATSLYGHHVDATSGNNSMGACEATSIYGHHVGACEASEVPAPPPLFTSSSFNSSMAGMAKSTSSNSSDQSAAASVCTVTGEVGEVVKGQLQEAIEVNTEESRLETGEDKEEEDGERGDKQGWSDDDIEVDKTSNGSVSSTDVTEHKRCLSMGSTASSSILMLQSPYDTTDSNGDRSDDKSDRSDKSDEDSLRTPTNLPLPVAPKLHLSHPAIVEEDVEVKRKRIITSPTHSEQSDLIVLGPGEANSPISSSEITKLKEILHAREQRLFRMNQEFVEMQDLLQTERTRSYDLQQNLCLLSNKHSASVERLEEELDVMMDLKNHLENELESIKSLGDIGTLQCELEERDALIEELTMEGEKLAQSSFNSSNNVKKLRQKEKEDERIIKDKTDKIDSLKKDIETLKDKLKNQTKESQETTLNVTELNTIITRQSDQIQSTRATLDELELQNMGLNKKIDESYAQISLLKEKNAETYNRASQETLSANIKSREKAQAAVEDVKSRTDGTIKQLQAQVCELQEVIARLDQQHVWKESRHRDQIQELHCRVEDADGRNQDLSTSITASTQPLLRQIQLLKESQSSQQANWEKIERDLKEKLDGVQADLSTVELEKREVSDRLQITRNKMSALQTQLDTFRAERNDLEVQVEVSESKIRILQEEKRKESSKTEGIKAQFVESLDESRRECEDVRTELVRSQSYARELETSKSVLGDVEEFASRSSTPPIEFTSQTNILERSLYGTSTPTCPSSAAPSISSYVLEKLTSQLKQSQSEVAAYQEQSRSLQLSKCSLSAEITRVSKQCDELELRCVELPRVRNQNKEFETRYNTLLQMYGEKAEEVHELQLDLADVREAYKAQIEQLLTKVIK